jgi:lipopolysaccharide transport system permease protein
MRDLVARLYRHRALVLAMLVRHLRARYRGSVLGFLWTFLNPILLTAVYSLVFRYYMRIDVPNYAIFLLAGLLPWMWFTAALSEGATSIVGGGTLVTKSLFPVEILPTVVVASHLVNFLFSIPILVVAALIAGARVELAVWPLLVPAIVLQGALTLGLVLALAALNVHYRDVQHILANLLLVLFFLTPILYPAEKVPADVRWLLWLNPMALLAGIYQAVLFDGRGVSPLPFVAIAAHAAAALWVGLRVFD